MRIHICQFRNSYIPSPPAPLPVGARGTPLQSPLVQGWTTGGSSTPSPHLGERVPEGRRVRGSLASGIKLLAVLPALLLLSSCVVGPNYKRPTVQAPTEFRGISPDQPA